MSNEVLFLIHAFVVVAFSFLALRFGKEAVTVWVALQGVLANLFVLKQMDCFGMTITCSDVYVIGSILALNFLQEFFDRESAKRATFVSFFAMIFFSTVSYLHLAYTPSSFDTTQASYEAIFTLMPMMTIVSVMVFFVSQRFDVFFFGFLKKRLNKIPFSLRSGMSMIASQTLDTALFTFFALRFVVEDPFAVFAVSLIIKCVVVFFMTTFLQIAKTCLPLRPLKATQM